MERITDRDTCAFAMRDEMLLDGLIGALIGDGITAPRGGGGGALVKWLRLAVTVYSPPMTGNRPELPGSYRGCEMVNPLVRTMRNRQ